MKKRGLDITLLEDVIDILHQGEQLSDKHRDHALTGNYQGFRECHIKSDWLLIYLVDNDVLVLTLVDTRTHSDFLKTLADG